MSFIQEEIEEVVAELGVAASVVPEGEAERIRDRLVASFTDGIAGSTFLWEDLRNDVSVQDPGGRYWISEFVAGQPAVLFFNAYQDRAMFLFADGADIAAAIAECTRFEFYITNPALDHILAFNHHDFVIAVGTAVDFVRKHGGQPPDANG